MSTQNRGASIKASPLPLTASQAPGICGENQRPQKPPVSLHLSVLAGFPCLLPKPSTPTWPGVPSFLAGVQEGLGSSQNVSAGFRGRLGNWKLSAVSLATSSQIILGMEEGGELCAGQPREAAFSPRKLQFLITCASWVLSGDRNHAFAEKEHLT